MEKEQFNRFVLETSKKYKKDANAFRKDKCGFISYRLFKKSFNEHIDSILLDRGLK